MRIKRRGVGKTIKDLLTAASEVFAAKGYKEATVADICERAGTNIAAVNYHFGDKETLYREAWRHAFLESVRLHPPDGGISKDAPPEDRLQGQVSALLRRIADKSNREFIIAHKELANPTGLLKEVIQESLRPLQERMKTLVRELLAPSASDMQVLFCTISIISQCINPMVVRRMILERQEDKDDTSEIDDIDAYAYHVVKFSLAGIQTIREEAEGKTSIFKRKSISTGSLKQE